MSGEGMKGMRGFVVQRMRENGAQLIPDGTPMTVRAIRLLRNVTSLKDGKLRGTDLERLERFRRALGGGDTGLIGAAANPTDRRNLRQMKAALDDWLDQAVDHRSEEHTSDLPSLMRISYAV